MEARMLQAFLRVLYTVNSNPQYILAKSLSQVPAIVCSEITAQSAKNEPAYARAPLKACLAAVCDSSPELLQDPARDFSLYVLDPLEAQPLPPSLAHTPHNTGSPRGVAVALGLMSWALESNDSTNVFVTGTIIPNALPALEVVFALRETKRMPKPILHSYPSFGLISAPGPSQPLNPPQPPQAAGMSWLSTYHLRRDQQTLTRSADFPELYIGPPRRARGRPEGSTSSNAKVMSQASASSLPGASSSKVVNTRSQSKQEVGRRSKQKTKHRPARAPPMYSPLICAPLTHHTATGGPEGGATGVPAFYQQPHPFNPNQTQSHAQLYPQAQPCFHATNNPLLGLLSAIPSTSSGNTATNTTPEHQAALLSALQGLLATNPHFLQLAATNMRLSASGEQTTENQSMRGANNADDEHDDGDSDIVILDSSTVDTTAFRKPSTRQLAASDHDTSPLTTNQGSPMPSSQGTDSSPLPASTPPSGQENAPASSETSTPTVTPEAGTPTSKHVSSGRTERGNVTVSHALDMPATPTPSRTRKRKLSEYVQGQAHSSTPMSPPSPSPSVTRISSSGRALTARQRIQSSPTGGTKSVSLPSMRLPSMLGSMRAVATSGFRLQASSLGSSTHRHPASLTTNKNGNQSITLVSGPSKSKADHPGITDASLNAIAPDITSLKRRRTLNEFMAEHEARKNTKVRKRSSLGRKLDVSANTPQAAPPQSAKLSTSRHTQSSPCRPLFRSDSVTSSLPASACQPGLAPGAAVSNPTLSTMTTLACTAPSASTSTAAPTENPLKNFVLPAWARTGTAMLPRLSEEALARQRAEREAKKAQVSLKRREAARAKRKRFHGVEHPCKESSDEDEEFIANDAKLRTLHPSSSVARSTPLLPLPLPSLPVFASDAVEPIPSSPPHSHRQLAPLIVPSTPPRKPVSSGSALHRTPNKSGSCSLFTPSGQDPGPLFTPSTPSVTRSLTRVTFTPRSPIVLHRSDARKSPRKSVPQTPWTPKCNSGNRQTPRSLRTGGNPQFVSPNLVIRTPQTQTGMGTRAFLLPPPSPCALRTPHLQIQVRSTVPGGSTPVVPEDSGIIKQESLSDKQNVERHKDCEEDDMLSREPDDALLGEDIPPAQCSPSRLTADEGQRRSELRDITSNGDASQAEEEYASSPLPPSSPPPASPFSSPTKHRNSNFDTPTINNLVVPDSDILLPSASDSDGLRGAADTIWLSDGACTASWFTDSEASAWFTETEAWLTDAEGGPLLTDSDGAWLSDSDAVFRDVSSLPPSSASNWLSDDADVDTDGDGGVMEGRGSGFDTAAFERAFAALVEREGRNVKDEVGGSGSGATHGTRVVESEFWESMQPLLGGDTLNDAGTTPRDVGDSVDGEKVAQDIQLLDGFVGT